MGIIEKTKWMGDGMKGFVFFDLDEFLNGESKVDVAQPKAIQTLKNSRYEPALSQQGRSSAETRDIMECNIHSRNQTVSRSLSKASVFILPEIPTEMVRNSIKW